MSQTGNLAGLRAVLHSAAPQLFVTDMKRSCDFFTQRLGFAVAFVYGEPPFYGQVARDGVRLNLRHVDAPLMDQALREREDYLSAAIRVDDVQRLYAEFLANGAPFHQHLKPQPWGATTFIVKDPDGNLLLFA
jgi:catechol 2,3-dioxygenase-like lactoylglutathione lyase family enzyme